MKFILIFLLFLSSTGSISLERAVVRQGPGAFFPAIAELGKGAQFNLLSEEEGWMNIRTGSVTGYVSSRSVSDQPARQGSMTRPLGRQVDMTVSSTGVSAAVRGVARQFAARLSVSEAAIDEIERQRIDPVAFNQFREETYPRGRRASSFRRQYRLPRIENEMLYYPIDEEGAGYAISAQLASRGLYRNASVEEYVSFVGIMVAEASHSYDLGFRFFILNEDTREAYSTPGGFVFITKGLLLQIQSEAELAGILAHEIAHITLRHGLKEMDNRRNVIAADDAFSELDNEVERTDEDIAITESLNNDLLTYRDRMYSMRIQDFEYAADAMALFYMARAGYTPQAMLNVVTRLFNNIPEDAPPYQANELSNRRDALLVEMEKPNWRGNLTLNMERYQEFRNRIR